MSKSSPLIIVKSTAGHADIAWAWVKVYEDMLQHPNRKAVVLFATGTNGPYSSRSIVPQPWGFVHGFMKSIIDLDGVIVVASGNRRDKKFRSDSDTYPALFESPQLPLIVVGAVDNSGALAGFSQGPSHVSLWAPGVLVPCTRPTLSHLSTGTGTSYSAGMVAGLAAYFLGFNWPGESPFRIGQGQTARNLRLYLQRKAWKRKLTGKPVIFNGENGFQGSVWNISDSSLNGSIAIA